VNTLTLGRIGAPRRLRRNLRLVSWDGAAFSLMVGAGEAYLPAFALFAGLGALHAALVATLPMLGGAFLGLASGRMVRRLRSNRRWVVAAAALQAASFVPLILAAWRGHAPAWLVYGAATAYWAGGLSTGPAWNTWMGDVVPAGLRARFFGSRARVVQGSVLVGLLATGLALQAAGAAEGRAFALVFAAAGLARAVSVALLAATDEPRGPSPTTRSVPRRELLRRLRHEADGRLLAYLVVLQAAVHVAGPFFTPYLLVELSLGYVEFTALTATTFVVKIFLSPRLGHVARRYGATALLGASGLLIAAVPAMWLVSSDLRWLLLAQACSGAAWAAHELGSSLLFLEALDADERTSLLSVFNVANASAVALGALLGGLALNGFGLDLDAYLTVFLASAVARVATLPLLRRLALPAGSGRRLVLLPARVLAIRPSSGPLERPILTAVDETKEAAEREHAAERGA